MSPVRAPWRGVYPERPRAPVFRWSDASLP